MLKIVKAKSWWQRFVGLIGRQLEQGGALYLPGARQVHTFFMRYLIDLAFVDAAGLVINVRINLKPWRISEYHKNAAGCLEMLAGEIRRLNIKVGDKILINN